MPYTRMVIATILGLIFGAVIAFPLGFLLGVSIVTLFKVSTFEGGSGYAVLATVMIFVPLFSLTVGLTNLWAARKNLPKKLLIAELFLALVSGFACLAFGIT